MFHTVEQRQKINRTHDGITKTLKSKYVRRGLTKIIESTVNGKEADIEDARSHYRFSTTKNNARGR